MAKYGYASEGESFSVMDKDEVWIMEIIGKGEGQLGAVWVATNGMKHMGQSSQLAPGVSMGLPATRRLEPVPRQGMASPDIAGQSHP